MKKALVTKIVRDSILDGPGCRYVIFVKGCHLRCLWCHNPESRSKRQEIMTYPQFCIQCEKCLVAAAGDTPQDVMPIKIDNKKLEKYLGCVEACPTNALEYAATEYSADELIHDMQKYRTVYFSTNGGMTISGGEPLLQKLFVLEVFQRAKVLGFHTAIDTTAAFKWSTLESVLPAVDLWLIDLKHPNDKSLKTELTISNLLELSKHKDVRIWVRMPIVPNYNDTPFIWEQAAKIIKETGDAVQYVDLLPFHPYGAAKYEALGIPYSYADFKPLDRSVIEKAKEVFARHLPNEKIRLGREMVNC